MTSRRATRWCHGARDAAKKRLLTRRCKTPVKHPSKFYLGNAGRAAGVPSSASALALRPCNVVCTSCGGDTSCCRTAALQLQRDRREFDEWLPYDVCAGVGAPTEWLGVAHR